MSRPESTEADYVILGAGSAGCVLANRLSSDPSNNVVILEAGPMDHKLMIHVPAGVYRAFKDPSINWNYLSAQQDECDDREIELPRGKVIGGSSSINSMVYMRGHPLDYDSWAEKYGLSSWRYEHCLPYFKRSEGYDGGEDAYRGARGPLGVSRSSLENPLFDALLEAGKQSGQGVSEDLNGFVPEGVARLDSTKKKGRRSSAAVAYLKPALKRDNLSLLTRAFVHRIEVHNGRAVAVEYSHNGETKVIRAAKEIIIACGAIKSPQLLMLSGIGDCIELKRHGIDPVQALPGVGKNLQDHLCFIVGYECTQDVTLHKLTRPLHKFAAGCRWLVTRKGVAASNIWEMGGLVFGNQQAEYPNLQYHFAPVYHEFHDRQLKLYQGYTLQVDQLRPLSRGVLELRSADPADAPIADFRYLSNPHDINELVEAFTVMEELMQQNALGPFRGRRIAPLDSVQTRAEIEAHIRTTVSTDYHPCGTCRMGYGDDAVVDEQLRVHGLDALRVVDASVMPDIVSGNLNAPVQMIAERAADFILGVEPLAPLSVPFHFQTG